MSTTELTARERGIVDMLVFSSTGEVAETIGCTPSYISQVARKAGLPSKFGNGERRPAKPKKPSSPPKFMLTPRVQAEYDNRKLPRQAPASRLPVVRAVWFTGYPGVYVWCWSCGFRTWQAPGAPLTCPKCARTLQIVYTPRKVGE